MPVAETIAFKLVYIFTKPALVVGGWIATLILFFLKDKQHPTKELVYKCSASIIGIPATLTVDSYYDLNKWAACTLSVFLSFTMWKILEKAEKKIPDFLEDKVDKL
jgi:hypothetical protein